MSAPKRRLKFFNVLPITGQSRLRDAKIIFFRRKQRTLKIMSYQFVKYIYLINAEFIYRKCRNKTLFINHNCKYLIKAKTTCKINGRIFPLSFRKLCPALKSYKVENYTTKLKAYSLWPVYVLPIDLTNSLLLILLY